MQLSESLKTALVSPSKMNVITNAILLARRIRELQRRRQGLVEMQEQLRTQLPDWAVEPLRLVGMTNNEVRGLVDDLSSAETESGLDEIEDRLNEIDQQLEELENILVKTPSSSLDEIEVVVDLLASRFREIFVTDPGDVFYDHGEARLLGLIERIQEDLTNLNQRAQLDVG